MCNHSGALFISVHVYKAGGSFVSEWLQLFCDALGGRSSFWSVWGHHDMREADWVAPYQGGRPASTAPPFMLATVRDPVDRFVSAMYELVKRNKWATPSLSSLLDEIDRRGFWEPHLYPQHVFLVDRDVNPLPLDYIGRGEFADEARTLLHDRMGVHGPLQSMQLRKRSEVLLARRRANSSTGELVHPSAREVSRICSLYRLDYVLLHIAWPSACSRSALKR